MCHASRMHTVTHIHTTTRTATHPATHPATHTLQHILQHISNLREHKHKMWLGKLNKAPPLPNANDPRPSSLCSRRASAPSTPTCCVCGDTRFRGVATLPPPAPLFLLMFFGGGSHMNEACQVWMRYVVTVCVCVAVCVREAWHIWMRRVRYGRVMSV